MLRLFQSLFGHEEETVCFPDRFIRESIERAVDGTDPAFRGLNGYRRTLRPAVLKGITHAAQIVDGFTPPLLLEPQHWDSDPHLHAFFVSRKRMQQLLENHPALVAYRREHRFASGPLYALMRMEMDQSVHMGVDRIKGVLTRGVAQTFVSFKGHQLVDFSRDPGEVRRLVKQRAFDHLLRLALHRLAMAAGLREELEQRSILLKAKMNLLKKGQWGLDLSGSDTPPNQDELAEQLSEIETLMEGVGDQTDYLENNLGIVADLIGEPEDELWVERRSMVLDKDGILRREPTEEAHEFTIQQAFNSEGWSMVVTLVEIPL